MRFIVSKHLILLLFVCFALLGAKANAQLLTYKTVTTEDGLLSDEILIFIQDSKGYMWFGTKSGLCRWDSRNFEYFTIEDGLPNNEVLFLYEDSKGRIWISCFGQEVCYYFNGHIYNSKNTPFLNKVKPRLDGHLVEKDNMLYYASDDSKLRRFNLTTLESAIINDTIVLPSVYLTLYKDKLLVIKDERDKNVFIEGRGKILFLTEDTCYYSSCYQFPDFPNTDIVVSADFKNKRYSFQHGIGMPFYHAKYTDKGLQIALYNKGKVLEVYSDRIVQKKDNYLMKVENPTNRPQIYEIKGNIFMRTTDGLLFCRQVPLLEYERQTGVNNNAQFIFKYKGEIYIVNNKFQVININRQQKVSQLKNNVINMYNLICDRNQFYLTTSYGVFYFSDPGKITDISAGKYFSNYKYINRSRKTDYFFTANGIHYGVNLTNFKKGISDTLIVDLSKSVYTVYEDSRSRLWYATTSKVYYTDTYYGGIKNSREFVLDKSSAVFCKNIQEDKKGNLFFTTNRGVFVYDGKNKYKIDRTNLLNDNECNKIVIDTVRNSFWVATKNGLTQIGYAVGKGGLTFNMLSRFFASDGLRSDKVNDLLLDSNKLYIATDKGVNILDDVGYHPDTMRIPIYIKLKTINSKADKRYDTLNKIALKHNQNNLSIGFSAIYFLRRDRLKVKAYLYRNNTLVSQSEITEDKIDYYSLNDGSYKLILYAYDEDYRYNKGESAPFIFIINPPYYKTWWFITGSSLLIIIVTTSLLLWRQGRKKQRAIEQAELQAKLNESTLKSLQSQMNPHFVFNSLNTIQSFITEKNEEGAIDYLSDFSVLMRDILEQSVHTFISLENELHFLQQYIRLEITRYKGSFDVEWHIELNEDDLTDIYIPTMLIQPILENAVKHGVSALDDKKGHITAIFSLVNENLLQVVIKDNGQPSTRKSFKGNSIAVKTIKDRLSIYTKNKIKGAYSLEVTETGATATITIPI